MKIKEELDANKKKGKKRDTTLLRSLLDTLFWKRSTPERTLSDILRALGPNYKNVKPDTLKDNLEFLSRAGDPPFLVESDPGEEIALYKDLGYNIERESARVMRQPGLCGRPGNLYSLDDHYIEDYFSKSVALTVGITAHVRANRSQHASEEDVA